MTRRAGWVIAAPATPTTDSATVCARCSGRGSSPGSRDGSSPIVADRTALRRTVRRPVGRRRPQAAVARVQAMAIRYPFRDHVRASGWRHARAPGCGRSAPLTRSSARRCPTGPRTCAGSGPRRRSRSMVAPSTPTPGRRALRRGDAAHAPVLPRRDPACLARRVVRRSHVRDCATTSATSRSSSPPTPLRGSTGSARPCPDASASRRRGSTTHDARCSAPSPTCTSSRRRCMCSDLTTRASRAGPEPCGTRTTAGDVPHRARGRWRAALVSHAVDPVRPHHREPLLL